MKKLPIILGGLLFVFVIVFLCNLETQKTAEAAQESISIVSDAYDGGKIAFHITRDNPISQKTFLCRTVSGTAIETVHFQPYNRKITFQKNESVKTIYIDCADIAYGDVPATAYISDRVLGRTFYLEVIDEQDVWRGQALVSVSQKISSGYYTGGFVQEVAAKDILTGVKEYEVALPIGYFGDVAERRITISYSIDAISGGTLSVYVASDISPNYTLVTNISGKTSKTHANIAFTTASVLRIKFSGGNYTVSNLKVSCTAKDNASPKLIDFFFPQNFLEEGQTFYISAVFDKIIGRISASAELVTTLGKLAYVEGVGTNVIVFSRVLDTVPHSIALSAIERTVQDYSSNQAVVVATSAKEIVSKPIFTPPQIIEEELIYNGSTQCPKLSEESDDFEIKIFDTGMNEKLPIDAGVYTIKVYFQGETVLDEDFEISPCSVTPCANTAVWKIYDGTENYGGSLSSSNFNFTPMHGGGIIPNETDFSITVGKFNASDITADSLEVLLSPSNGNFVFIESNINVPAAIYPREISVTSSTYLEKVYDGTTEIPDSIASEVDFTVEGAVGDVEIILQKQSFNAENVDGATFATFSILLSDPNYTLLEDVLTLAASITPRELSIVPLSAVEKVYDGTDTYYGSYLEGVHYLIDGAIGDEHIHIGIGRFNDANAAHASSVTAGASINNVNYTLTSAAVTFLGKIQPRFINIDTSAVVLEKVYDGTGDYGKSITLDDVKLDVNLDSLSFTAQNMDSLAVGISRMDVDVRCPDSNYSVPQTIDFTVNVTPRPITVSALRTESVYGEDANLLYDAPGLVAGDKLEGTLFSEGKGVGVYSIQSQLFHPCYDIFYYENEHEILPRCITVRALESESVYGEGMSFDYILDSALVGSDCLNESLFIDGANVGKYEISFAWLNENYLVEYIPAFHVVTQREVTIKVMEASFVYGDEISLQYTVTQGSVLDCDSFELYIQGSDAGCYDIMLDANDNYKVNVIAAECRILPRPIKITLYDQTVQYGDSTIDKSAFSVDGLATPDSLDILIYREDGALPGEYRLFAAANSSGNYQAEVTEGTYRIVKASSKITLQEDRFEFEKIYDKKPFSIQYHTEGEIDVVLVEDGKIRQNSFIEPGVYSVTLTAPATECYHAPLAVNAKVVIRPSIVTNVAADGTKIMLESEEEGFCPTRSPSLSCSSDVGYTSIWRKVVASYECKLPSCKMPATVVLQPPAKLINGETVTVAVYTGDTYEQVELKVENGKVQLELVDGQKIAFLSPPKMPAIGILIILGVVFIIIVCAAYMIFVAR